MEEGAFGFRARLLLSSEALLRNFHLFDLLFSSLSWGSWTQIQKSHFGILGAIFGLQMFLSGLQGTLETLFDASWQGLQASSLPHSSSLPLVVHLVLFSGSQEAPARKQTRWCLGLVSKDWMFDQGFSGSQDPPFPFCHFTVLSQVHFCPQTLTVHVPDGHEREIVWKDGPCQLATLTFTPNLKMLILSVSYLPMSSGQL